jgi:hypothetical protein
VRHPRRVALAGVLAALVTLLLPDSAHAEETTTITVTPSTGLVDDQTVIVSGTGLASFTRILQCGPAVGPEPDLSAAVTHCDLGQFVNPTVDPQGGIVPPTPFIVMELLPTSAGTVDCTANPCSILLGGLGGVDGFISAIAPIRFGSATPATKAACKQGGWRSLADDQGQPFRNQGQCVKFVVARRR